MIPEYVQAFTSRPPVVLKRQLRAYSLGHDFLLEAAGNSFATGAGPHSLEDFLLAVHVCTLPFSEACNTPDVDAAKWADENTGADWPGEIRAFLDYLAKGRAVPPRKIPMGSKPHNAPWQLCVAAAIAGNEAMTPERMAGIMDMPVAQAVLWTAVRRETLGDESLLSEEEHAIIQQGKALANVAS